MRQNQLAYYAAIYPVLIGVLIQVIADKASPIERVFALTFTLACAAAGAFLWTCLEHCLHRFVLQGDRRMTGQRPL